MTLTTRARVAAGFAIAFAVLLAVGATAILAVKAVEDQLEDVASVHLPQVQAANTLNISTEVELRSLSALMHESLTGSAIRSKLEADVVASQKDGEAARAALEALPRSPELDQIWKRLSEHARIYNDRARQLSVLLLDKGQAGGAEAFRTKGWSLYQITLEAMGPLDEDLEVLGEQVTKEAAAARQAAAVASRRSDLMQAVAVAVGAAVLLLSALWVTGRVSRALRRLRDQTSALSDAVLEGRLGERADPAVVDPEFRGITEGLNRTMDAFVRPIQVTSEYVARISRGDIPPRITDAYQGDFNTIKDSLNQCIGAVSALLEDAGALSRAAVQGQLSTRADASRHQGDFRKVVEGVNETLDAVLAPVHEATRVLEDLARRDLRARVTGDYRGEHARIKDSLNGTAQALHEALENVAIAATQVNSASAQIAASSQAVAGGASEQAAALEETSSSLESIDTVTRQSAGVAQQASSFATEARASAMEGANAMERMNGAMSKIRDSAQGTSQIIKDINEIAFQTNLLALNAAVEAARAGEAGRGFAVVAEEVRSLALRCKEAAGKTEELIRESVRQASEGEATSAQVSAKLGEIVGAVGKVTDLVAELAATGQEQQASVSQISRAVGQMGQVTQQNAASSEQASSSAQELAAQAEQLGALVGTFQLARA